MQRQVGIGLGCGYALDGKKSKAFGCLEKAIEKGFKDRAWRDRDLETPRGDRRYLKLQEKLTMRPEDEAGAETEKAAERAAR